MRGDHEQTLPARPARWTRRYDAHLQNPGHAARRLVIDDRSRLCASSFPRPASRSCERCVERRVARATSRNPTDADVTIPANGFNIAGTLTTPPSVATASLIQPSCWLAARAPRPRRTVVGIPIFAQLAKTARRQRLYRPSLRQRGGRPERRPDRDRHARGLRGRRVAAVKWMAKRDDVDPRRIAVAGHGEGGAVALLAAGRDKRSTAS